MIYKIIKLLDKVSLTQTNGRFLSDKSYAYDDVYFMSKYIIETVDDANVFNKSKEEKRVNEYIKDIFQLRGLGSGAINYLTEALNILIFSGVIEKLDRDRFKIIHKDILEYISDRVENAYIFLYLIVFKTFCNDGIIDDYIKFANEKTRDKKETILKIILGKFKDKSVSIGGRSSSEDTNWSKQLVKYALVVLGYANETEYVTRTLKIQLEQEDEYKKVDVENISINIEGTRTNENSKKINDYIYSFAKNYIQNELKPYLIKDIKIDPNCIEKENHIAEDLASLKIEKLILETDENEYKSRYEQDQFIERKVKIRNQNIQKTFKEGLLKNNAHRCPICGFEYEDFLIASHIRPYAKCDDTYDVINNYNGLLLCPNHDKLFEGAKLMTIDAETGEIVLAKSVENTRDFGKLKGQFIDKSLVECERRHYLKWHNEQFKKFNKILSHN